MKVRTNTSGWCLCELGDVITLQRGHDLPQKKRLNGVIPIISSSGPTGFHNQAKSKGPGVVTGRYGTLGEVFYVAEDYWPLNTTLYVKDFKGNNARFVAYFLQTMDLERFNGAGAVPGLNRNHLHKLRIRFPSDTTIQQSIVNHLSNFDDLLGNNTRRISLLEEAAQQIYREWFVRHRFPGHESTSIVDGIPDGWNLRSFSDVCQAIGGGTPSTKRPEYWNNGTVTWMTPTDITRNDCLVILDSEKKITDAGLARSSAKLVPPDTILMTSRASVGFFGLIDKEVCTNQGFISIVPNEEHYRMFLLFNLIHRVEEIRSNAGGATYKEINKTRFRAMPVLMPTDKVLKTFHAVTYPIIQLIRRLKRQNAKLVEARDLLLPRLMSGEIQT